MHERSDAYELFQEGRKRLRGGMSAQATVPLEKAKRLEPQKASIREALGIAYFRLRRWEEAEAEFRAVLDLAPTDDYAHYALGRALEQQGREVEATTSSPARWTRRAAATPSASASSAGPERRRPGRRAVCYPALTIFRQVRKWARCAHFF